ncbi:ATP-binding protein [Pararcticibacter amylolyticus]|uniref:ATPase AAA-type core domain-containing protein n=1 Tax=Pararcticibacter amylolyticus TaxID=2173175 RepID=A0A2U2P9T4_9SPHI|nr:ATP-binding protein [Pararcticibacter amylolyticus]PWG78054.1 hypothetical protein DDR33_24250 [Pararcticibacter amylolyticus]
MDQIVTYETPTIIKPPTEERPIALANKSFPYNSLADDRRFEELVYSIFQTRIKTGVFRGFDGISLMSGVRDKGRDCVLIREGKNHGLVQCKKYKNNLGKQVFGEEITKFVMYSLLNKDLIPDRNDFVYHIAVSEGFVLECSDFIDDFNNLIASETELASWIGKNLRHPTLAVLKLDNVEPEVRDILTRIKVKKIFPQDLDSYLSEQECRHLQPLFFEIRSLIDNQPVEELAREFRTFASGELKKEQLDEELSSGSSSLKHEINQFEDIPNSHVQRSETSDLLQWLEQPAQKDDNGRELNICLLAGNAGIGKTVILKDLYDELKAGDVPVLALKADKLYATSITELQKKIGLPIPVFQFVEQCKQKYKQVVLLIDQIDALSQAMSADRSFLDVYKSLIDRYTHDPNVRIIISVRLFDLHYDPSLRVYKNIKTIQVAPLSESQVYGLLDKIGIKAVQVSTKLLQLLRVPNHLNIFARIAPGFSENLGITNIQGLYNELWKQKVVSKPRTLRLQPKRVKQLLYKLVKQMYLSQRISLPEQPFEDYEAEISYLGSERILKREDMQIQFFHQSFYDFVFAKRFVEKGEDLIKYIKKQEQSIMIRSALKMILNYLREYDPQKYEKIMADLLEDQDILYHIKHMLVSMLAFLDHPSVEEKEIIAKILSTSVHLSSHFFEQARSEDWFEFAMDMDILSFFQSGTTIDCDMFSDFSRNPENSKQQLEYLQHTAWLFLSRFVKMKSARAWDFLPGIKNVNIVRSFLYEFDDWSFQPAYDVLENCGDFMGDDEFGYLHILEKIATHRPEYAWTKVKTPLSLTAKSDKNSHSELEEAGLLKLLAESIPETMIPTLEEIVVGDLPSENILSGPLIGDYNFTCTNLHDSEDLIGREYFYRLLAVCLRRVAKKDAEEFRAFLSRHKKSKHEAMLRLIIFAIETNEAKYFNEVFDLFCYMRDIGALIEGQDFRVEFRNVFEVAFPHFSKTQKSKVVYTLQTLVNKQEIYIYKYQGTPKFGSYWGRGKYAFLLRLPEDTLKEHPVLKRQLLELERKFGRYLDRSNNGPVLAGVVGRPLPENAYSKMSVKQWLSSFRRYAVNRDPFGGVFFKGGIDEHSNAFRDAASKEPAEKMFSIIEKSLADREINIIYPIKGLWGLVDAGAEHSRAIAITKKILEHPEVNSETRYILYFIEPLVSGEQTDSELVQFLITQSENYAYLKDDRNEVTGETSVGGLITRGINTIHGSAANALLWVQDSQFEEPVFAALECLLSTAPDETRAALYFRFAHLNNLNRGRAYDLFRSSLMKETNIFVIACSIWSLQYMGNINFQGLIPVYEKLVVSDTLGKDDTNCLVSILYFSYLFDKPGAEELLYKLFDNNPKSRVRALSESCKYYYFNEESAEKTRPLLMYLVNKFANDPEDHMQIRLFHIDHIKLKDIYDFLEAYIDSASFTFSGNLLKYLTQQCHSDAQLSVQLFKRAISRTVAEKIKREHMREKDGYTKFIVGALTAIKGKDETSRRYRQELLFSFDTILKDYQYKSDTERVLEELL